MQTKKHALSSFSPGTVGETLALFFPLLLSIFSGSMMHFFDRLFISQYSLISLKAMTAANYYILFFQLIMMRVVVLTKVCVGRSYGEKNDALIGPYCWQMIWFSIASIGITLPVGLSLIPYLFKGTEIATEGALYFKILLFGNFLFPLGTTLSSYFIGLGKTKVVGIATFGAQCINIALNYLLIFGTTFGIPSLGIKGAALGTVFAQSGLCLTLFYLFLKGNQAHRTRSPAVRWPLFKEVFLIGLPRILTNIMLLGCWNLAVVLITRLEGDYLLVFSVGSSIWITYSPLIRSIEQVIITQVSFYRGKKEYSMIWHSARSSLFVISGFFCLFGLVLYFWLDPFLSFFIHEPLSPQSLRYIHLCCFWLWLFFLFEGVQIISVGMVTGLEKTWYSLKYSLFTSYLTCYLPFHIGFNIYHLGPDKIYLLCSVCMIVSAPIYFLESKKTITKLQKTHDEEKLPQPI
ncbi:MAG: polysaccharide biosynthesis C-terminal domain-containing protein [Chlamydiia bacterium]|nr:polysaccharide biosynthesis C-terminal domain-containing protein [Chlamydiia bacterium]